MSNYIVSDSNLTSVANAIRTKGGTSEQLAFPAGFVSAIEAIQTGGGGVPGVTVLRGHGTTPVDLPSGFSFPDVSDCFSSDPADPFVGAYLLFFEVDYIDDVLGETHHERFLGLTDGINNGDKLVYNGGDDEIINFTAVDGAPYVDFQVSNNTIAPSFCMVTMMSEGIINANTEWLMIVVDERGLSE